MAGEGRIDGAEGQKKNQLDEGQKMVNEADEWTMNRDRVREKRYTNRQRKKQNYLAEL